MPRPIARRFHGFASAFKTHDMGVRVEAEEGESLADALKRLRVLLHKEGGHPISHAKWHKKRLDRYEKPSILRRRRRWVAIEKRIRGWAPAPWDQPALNNVFTLRTEAPSALAFQQCGTGPDPVAQG